MKATDLAENLIANKRWVYAQVPGYQEWLARTLVPRDDKILGETLEDKEIKMVRKDGTEHKRIIKSLEFRIDWPLGVEITVRLFPSKMKTKRPKDLIDMAYSLEENYHMDAVDQEM